MIFPIKLINEITNVGYNLKRDSYNRIIFDEVTEPLSRLQWPMNHSERRVWMRRRNSPLTDPNRKPHRRSTLLNILTKRRGRAFPFTLRFRNILFQFSINVRLFLETIFAYPQFNFIANTFHKLFYFSKSRNTVQASFVPSTAFVLCERILIPVNRKDRKGPKRGLIRGAFPPYDLSVARKRQHLYTRNSCRYTAIGTVERACDTRIRAPLAHATRIQRQARQQIEGSRVNLSLCSCTYSRSDVLRFVES